MKAFLALSVVFLGITGAAAGMHSLQYLYTASSGIPDFPEFVTVGMVDGQPFSYYDSVIKKEIPKQDWMAKNEGPEYWESNTQKSIGSEQTFKGNIEIAKQRFNQTGGVHLVQNMYGCEWDDETNKVNGYFQYGYDGEDWISLDLKTETWIAPKPQAFITKQKWDHDKAAISYWKNYIMQECPEWLKKYVKYGRSSLMRKDLPSVSLLQKTPSSQVTCHATGFYPDRADLFWRKDGEELHEDVDKGEILPNHDGTFQMSVDLKISSIAPEDWKKYDCVFQLSGVKGDHITKLKKSVIRTNEDSSGFPVAAAVALGVGGLLVLAACITAVVICRRKYKGFSRASNSDTSSSSAEDPDPKKKIHFYTQDCPQWLKNYVNYERSSLMRKDLPSVSLLQKTPCSPVTCHATGFYLNIVDLFWRKDGEELHEDVDKGEILPNHDGTFQMSVDLKISSIAPEDWKKYDCVFGVKDDIIIKLDKAVIRTNQGSWIGSTCPPAEPSPTHLRREERRRKGETCHHLNPEAEDSDISSSSAEDLDPKKRSSDEQKIRI